MLLSKMRFEPGVRWVWWHDARHGKSI